VRTGGHVRNHDYVAGRLDAETSPALEAMCLDPQTSGGLLAAVDRNAVPALLEAGFWAVGTVEAGEPGVVLR
jgi:hypothetical protein